MNKIFINTMDHQVNYNFSVCKLITTTYKVKLKKNEVHSPTAAKLIVEDDENILKAFLLKQPIIKVDQKGDVEVLTTMSWDEATYKEEALPTKDEISRLKHTKKLLMAKKSIGLSFEEIFEEKNVVSKLDIINLRKNILKEDEGGGF